MSDEMSAASAASDVDVEDVFKASDAKALHAALHAALRAALRAALETQEQILMLHAAALHYNAQGFFIRVPDDTIEQWAQLARVRAEGAAVHADAALEGGPCKHDDLVSTSPELERLCAYVCMGADINCSSTLTSWCAEAGGALVRAATLGHAGSLGAILAADAHVIQSSALNSALICAARNGHAAIVRLLLCDGRANPSARCSECMRAALLHDHSATVDLLRLDGRAVPFEIAKTDIEIGTKHVHAFLGGVYVCLDEMLDFNEQTRVAGLAVHTIDGIELDSVLWINGQLLAEGHA
jgi:hypothetical protein